MEGKVLRDDRKFYLFTLPDKRKVETKAHTEEEARKIIETILDLKLAA
jgi:hypothetical protein